MPRKSSISRLSPEIKSHIEAMLATGAQTLEEMIRELQERFPLQARAGTLPSRSALHRYGAKLERRLSNVRATTEAMRLVREHAGDAMDARSEALMAMVQTELFDAMMSLQEANDPDIDPAERVALLSAAGKNLASLTTGSVRLKRYQAEAEERGAKKLLAKQQAQATEMAKDGMLPEEILKAVVKTAYGMGA
jgi:hypothetical protein